MPVEKQMLKKVAMLLSLTLMFNGVSHASVETLKVKLGQQYPNVKIDDLKATEMQGLYSGTLDNQIVYVNEQAEHIFVGSMIRLKDQRNLTKDLAVQQQPLIDIQKLPLNDAIKTVKGTGKRQLVVFSDPNCPYCKTLDANLAQLNDVTIYTFLYPIKTQSIIPSKQVWCSPNKAYAWQNLMAKGVQPTAVATCETPIERNLLLGKQLGLTGTPVIIFSNGQKAMGAYSSVEINKIWQQMGL